MIQVWQFLIFTILAFMAGFHFGARIVYKRALKRLGEKNAEIKSLQATIQAAVTPLDQETDPFSI